MSVPWSRRLRYKVLFLQAALTAVICLVAAITLRPAQGGSALWWLIKLCLIVGLSTLITYRYTRNQLFGPVQSIISAIRRITRGQLDERITLSSKAVEELAELSQAVNAMADHYCQVVRETAHHRNYLNAIVSSLVDALLLVDQDLRLTMVNPAAERLLGVSPDRYGRYLLESIRNYDLVQVFQRVLQEKKPAEQDIQVFLPRQRTLRAHVTPVRSPSGTVVGVVAILHDITEIMRLEKVRSDFVANVSHELRTPLTSIKGFVETLLDGAWEDPESARRFLSIISAETNRMVALVNDLLKLSRLEAGDADWHPQPVNLAEVLRDASEPYQLKAKEQNIRFEIDIAPDPPPVLGDATLLRQVAANLLDNAFKYTESGGTVRLSLEHTDEHVKLTVADTGIGIPAKHLHRIFERFYRVDRGRSRKMGGTGLGLAIVKHIVEKHQGEIEVESEYGEGTRMTVILPISRDQTAVSAAVLPDTEHSNQTPAGSDQ